MLGDGARVSDRAPDPSGLRFRIGEVTVHADPVAKGRPRLGNGRIFTPRTTELAEHRIRETWEREVGVPPQVGPVALRISVHVRQPASLPKRSRLTARPIRRPDLDNYVKTVLDALNGVAYLDDAQVVEVLAQKRYALGEAPHWVIALEAIG